MRIGPSVVAAFLLTIGLAHSAGAAYVYTAPPEKIAPLTDHVVRGTVDPEARTVAVAKAYRGDLAGKTVRVENLREFGVPHPSGETIRTPAEAILLLHELDGRYHLVHTASPAWVAPHASIKYVGRDGRLLGYAQVINPGGVVLVEEKERLAAFETRLGEWLAKPRPGRERRPDLPPEEAKRFHDLISPTIDYYRRRSADAHRETWTTLTSALVAYVGSETGETRRRGIEALLILARQFGPEQPRREHVEERLIALLDRLGPAPFVEPLMGEIRSVDVGANKRTAARLLRRIGGAAVQRARVVLVELMRQNDVSLVSEAYWALRYMGLEAEAEKAR